MEVIKQVYPSEREAYAVYGQGVAELTLGKVEDLWDQVAMAEYPNRAALVAMASSDAYQKIAVHRNAGLEGQLNIETVPQNR